MGVVGEQRGGCVRKRGDFFRILERFVDDNWIEAPSRWGNVWIVSLENAEEEARGKWNIISIDRRNVKYLSSRVRDSLPRVAEEKRLKNESLLDNQIHSRTCLNSPSLRP